MARTLGTYELVERIAVGGIAEIFLARNLAEPSAPHYALKILLPQYAESEEHRKMLVDEARLTASLAHPNIVEVHDVVAHDDTLFMVMEYLKGRDLASLVEQARLGRTQVPVKVAAYIIAEVCGGLHFAHTRTGPDGQHLRLVHRDVSPRNILIGDGGEVKLLDFGVAKADAAGRMETKTGIIKGKLGYMAPEYAVGELQDARSDIFSTTLCLYEALTGRPAYDRSSPAHLIEAVKNAAVPSPSIHRADLPRELEAVLEKGLQPNPNNRFASALQMQQALRAYLDRHASDFGREDLVRYVLALQDASAPAPAADDEFASERTAMLGGPSRKPERPTLPTAAVFAPEDELAASTTKLSRDELVGGAPKMAGLAELARESRDPFFSDSEDIAVLATVSLEQGFDALEVTQKAAAEPQPQPPEETLPAMPIVPEDATAPHMAAETLRAGVEEPPHERSVTPTLTSQAPAACSLADHAPSSFSSQFAATQPGPPPPRQAAAVPNATGPSGARGRQNDVIAIVVLAICFVSLLFWVFFLAE